MLNNDSLKTKNDFTNASSFVLFSLAAFFSTLVAYGISFKRHFIGLPYFFLLLDFKFYKFSTRFCIENYQRIWKYLALIFITIACIVFRSSNPFFYSLKVFSILLLILYFFVGFHSHGLKALYVSFVFSIIYSLAQFIEVNFFHKAFLSIDRISHNITHTPFYFGPMKRKFSCYAPGVFKFTERIFRVSSFNPEPGVYCSMLTIGLLIFFKKKIFKYLAIIGFFVALSKTVVFQAIGFLVWIFLKRLPIFFLTLAIGSSYLILGNLWLIHLKRIGTYRSLNAYAHKNSFQKTNTYKKVPVITLVKNVERHFQKLDKERSHKKNKNKKSWGGNSIIQRFEAARNFLTLPLKNKILGTGLYQYCKLLNIKKDSNSMDICLSGNPSNIGSLIQSYGVVGLLIFALFLELLVYRSQDPNKLKFIFYGFLIATLSHPFLQFRLPHYLLISYGLFRGYSLKNWLGSNRLNSPLLL